MTMNDQKISSDSEIVSEERHGPIDNLPILSIHDCLPFSVESVGPLESELDVNEKVSLIFLLYNNAVLALSEIGRLNGNGGDTIMKWCLKSDKSGKGWQFVLIESLVLIQNYKVLKKLGIDKYDALKIFKPDDLYFTLALNPIKKTLYTLCESLSMKEKNALLDKANLLIDSKTLDRLEIFFLTLMSKNLFDVNDRNKISKIAQFFKQIERVDLANFIENMVEVVSGRNSSFGKTSDLHLFKSTKQVLKRNDNCYTILNNNCVGLCIIINQQTFVRLPNSQDPQLTNRDGSSVDRDRLEKIFKNLNFTVVVMENLPHNEICHKIVETVKSSFLENTHSIFTLIILSHGIEGCVYGTDCRLITINAIKHSLSNDFCESLDGKPKVLIIQACQGKKFYDSSNIDADSNFPCEIATRVSDLLVCVATVPGFKAFRHKTNGSWYIQALCKSLENNRDEDIYSIVTKVNHELLSKYFVYLSDANNCARRVSMLSEFTSCLSKTLYLCP